MSSTNLHLQSFYENAFKCPWFNEAIIKCPFLMSHVVQCPFLTKMQSQGQETIIEEKLSSAHPSGHKDNDDVSDVSDVSDQPPPPVPITKQVNTHDLMIPSVITEEYQEQCSHLYDP